MYIGQRKHDNFHTHSHMDPVIHTGRDEGNFDHYEAKTMRYHCVYHILKQS